MALLSTVLVALTAASVIFAVAMTLVNLYLADRRSWIMSVVRLGMTLVAAALALPIARLLAGVFTDDVYSAIVPVLGDELSDFLGAAPDGLRGMRVIVSMVISLLLYVAVFLALRLFFVIVGIVLCRFMPQLKEKTRRGVALPVGALNGLLIAVIVLAPICGFLAMGGNVLGNAAVSADKCGSAKVETLFEQFGTDSREVRELAKDIEKNPVISVVSNTVGRPVFAVLAERKLELSDGSGETVKMKMEQDMSAMVCTFIHLTDVNEALGEEDFDTTEKVRLHNLSDSIAQSRWVTVVAADALAELSEKWKQNESFAGMQRPEMNKVTEPAFDSLLDVLSEQTPNTMDEDMDVLMDVMGDLVAAGLLKGSDDSQQLIRNTSDNDFFEKVAVRLDSNVRFTSVAYEFRLISTRLVASMLGAESLRNGEHDALMQDVASDLTSVIDFEMEQRHEVLPPMLEQTFANYGYELPQNVAVEVADRMIEDLGADGEITGGELTEYLIEYA